MALYIHRGVKRWLTPTITNIDTDSFDSIDDLPYFDNMRLPIPAISALLLSLPAVLGKVFPVPLKIVLATDWSDGFVDVWDPENKEINIKTLTHTIPVDGQDIWDIHEYTIAESKEEKQDLFRVRRTAWGTSRRVVSLTNPEGGIEIDI